MNFDLSPEQKLIQTTARDLAAREIAPVLMRDTVVVNKSTVPVGSTLLVERALDGPVCEHPLADIEAEAALDERRRLGPERVVEVRHAHAPQLEHVAARHRVDEERDRECQSVLAQAAVRVVDANLSPNRRLLRRQPIQLDVHGLPPARKEWPQGLRDDGSRLLPANGKCPIPGAACQRGGRGAGSRKF